MSSSAGSKGALQNYNNELVRCIDDLREKREELNRSILRDEEEKAKIQKVRAPRCRSTHQSVARPQPVQLTNHRHLRGPPPRVPAGAQRLDGAPV